MPIVTYRIDDELQEGIDRAAKARGVPRTLVVREAISTYLATQQGARPSLVELADKLAVAAGSGVGDLATRSEAHLRARFGSTAGGKKRARGDRRSR